MPKVKYTICSGSVLWGGMCQIPSYEYLHTGDIGACKENVLPRCSFRLAVRFENPVCRRHVAKNYLRRRKCLPCEYALKVSCSFDKVTDEGRAPARRVFVEVYLGSSGVHSLLRYFCVQGYFSLLLQCLFHSRSYVDKV